MLALGQQKLLCRPALIIPHRCPRRSAPFGSGSPIITPEIYIPEGAAFNPTSLITGTGGFWRADMGVTGSAPVTAWTDQSSSGNNLSQNGSAGNPTFSSTGFNTSFSGISFVNNGGSSLLSAGLTRTTTTLSMFLLLQTANNPTSGDNRLAVYWDGHGSDSTLTTTAIMLYGDGAGGGFYNYNSGVVGNGGGKTVSNAGVYLFGVVYDGANANTWLNGTVQGSASADTNTLGTGSSFLHLVLGTTSSISGATTPAFTAAFFGITEKAMNSTDWTNLKNWSNSNWGTSF